MLLLGLRGSASSGNPRSVAAQHRCCGSPELHIGPASHLQWWPQAQRLMLHFFDRHLKLSTDIPTSVAAPQFWDQTSHEWQDLPRTTQQCWQLQGDGLTSIDPESGTLDSQEPGQGTVTFVHDPWRPVPAIGGHLSPDPGPAERSRIDQRADVATFTGCELGQPLKLQGQPVLTLRASGINPGLISVSRCPGFPGQLPGATAQHWRTEGVRGRGSNPFAAEDFAATAAGDPPFRRPIAGFDRRGGLASRGSQSGNTRGRQWCSQLPSSDRDHDTRACRLTAVADSVRLPQSERRLKSTLRTCWPPSSPPLPLPPSRPRRRS